MCVYPGQHFESEPVLLITGEPAAVGIGPVAEALFDELLTFGRLISCRGYDWEAIEPYVENRVMVARFLVSGLEHFSHLRFAHANADSPGYGNRAVRHIPFCYNRGDWPVGGPLAGYSNSSDAPLPHQVITSMLGNWKLDSDEDSSTTWRMLTVALWACASRGLLKSIELLLDLQLHGFVPSKHSVADVIVLLLRARAAAGSDAGMVSGFFGGSIPESTSDWLEADISTDWLGTREGIADEGGVVPFVLARVRTAVETAQAADSLDQWVLGCSDVRALNHTLRQLVTGSGIRPSTTVRAELAQLDEMATDAAEFIELAQSGEDWAGYVQLLGQGFEVAFGDEWKEALYRERLVVPTALRRQLLDLEGEFPDTWAILSWRVAIPFLFLRHPKGSPLLTRTQPFDAADVLADQRMGAFFDQHKIVEPADRRLIVEAEIRRDQQLAASVSYPKSKAGEQIRTIASELSLRELTNFVYEAEALKARRDAAGARRVLESSLKLYPWSQWPWWELAIWSDQMGAPDDALSFIIPAIVLNPSAPEIWQSLKVILSHFGRDEEAAVASAISHYYADAETSGQRRSEEP